MSETVILYQVALLGFRRYGIEVLAESEVLLFVDETYERG